MNEETYHQVQDRYTELTNLFIKTPLGKTEERKRMEKDIELFKKVLDKVRTNVFEKLIIILHNYSKSHQDDYILPALINETTFVRSKLTSYLAGEDLSVHVC